MEAELLPYSDHLHVLKWALWTLKATHPPLGGCTNGGLLCDTGHWNWAVEMAFASSLPPSLPACLPACLPSFLPAFLPSFLPSQIPNAYDFNSRQQWLCWLTHVYLRLIRLPFKFFVMISPFKPRNNPEAAVVIIPTL